MIFEYPTLTICLGVSHSFTPVMPWVIYKARCLTKGTAGAGPEGFQDFLHDLFSFVNEWLSIFLYIFSSFLSHDPRIPKQGPNNHWVGGYVRCRWRLASAVRAMKH